MRPVKFGSNREEAAIWKTVKFGSNESVIDVAKQQRPCAIE